MNDLNSNLIFLGTCITAKTRFSCMYVFFDLHSSNSFAPNRDDLIIKRFR